MIRAVPYLRVSTEEQTESGLGLEAQRSAIEAHCVRNGWVVDGWHADEGLSGSLPPPERPGLVGAIADVRRGDVLIVYKRDRVVRGDPVLIAMIEGAVRKQGGRLVSVAGEGTEDDSPTNILMRRIVDAFGEYERLLIAARTKAALKAKAARGERAGTIPYGKRLDPTGPARSRSTGRPCALEVDPVERAALEAMVRWRAEGKSYGAIARALDAQGIPSRSGNPWRKSTVYQVLKRLADGQGQAS